MFLLCVASTRLLAANPTPPKLPEVVEKPDESSFCGRLLTVPGLSKITQRLTPWNRIVNIRAVTARLEESNSAKEKIIANGYDPVLELVLAPFIGRKEGGQLHFFLSREQSKDIYFNGFVDDVQRDRALIERAGIQKIIRDEAVLRVAEEDTRRAVLESHRILRQFIEQKIVEGDAIHWMQDVLNYEILRPRSLNFYVSTTLEQTEGRGPVQLQLLVYSRQYVVNLPFYP